jgi:hypothetical protein
VHRIAYADNIILLSGNGRLADEGTYNDVNTSAKEIALEPKPSLQAKRESLEETTLGPLRPPSLIETPQGSERRTGDMTVYKYYVRAVRPWNAIIFAIACAMFVIGLSLPREYSV